MKTDRIFWLSAWVGILGHLGHWRLGAWILATLCIVARVDAREGLSLSWRDNASNESGFEVERSMDGASYETIATLSANVTEYVDLSIEADQEYWYRVRAFNAHGRSGYTNAAKGVLPLPPEPEPEPEPDPQPESQPEPDPDQGSEPEKESGPEPEPEPEGDSGTSAESDAGSSPSEEVEGSDALDDSGESIQQPASAAPVVTGLDDVLLEEGQTYIDLAFSVTDADTQSGQLAVDAYSSNETLVSSKGLKILGTGGDYRLRIAPFARVSGEAEITVEASDGENLGDLSFRLTVPSSSGLPIIELQPVFVDAVEGGEAVFSVLASSDTEVNYQWLFNGEPIGGATDSIFGYDEVAAGHSGRYSVVVSNELGSVTSDVVDLIIHSPLSISANPESQILEDPGSVTLAVTAEGQGLSYQWYAGESGDTSHPILGATGQTFTTPVLVADASFWVRVSQGSGSLLSEGLAADSSAARIRVEDGMLYYFARQEDGNPGELLVCIEPDGTGVVLGAIHGLGEDTRSFAIRETFDLADDQTFRFDSGTVGLVSGRMEGNSLGIAWLGLGVAFEGSLVTEHRIDPDLVGRYWAKLLYVGEGELDILMAPNGEGLALLSRNETIVCGQAFVDESGSLVADFDGLLLDADISGQHSIRGALLDGSSDASINILGSKVGGDVYNQLVNTSIRANLHAGDGTMISGFVITGPEEGKKMVLARAMGPKLRQFDVEKAADDPAMELYRITQDGPVLVGENDDWEDASNAALAQTLSREVGAVGFDEGARDAGMLAELGPGIYSVLIRNMSDESGTALVEIFDVDHLAGDASTLNLTNISTRGLVGNGSGSIFAGFVVEGNAPKRFLIRAAGIELERYGVEGALIDTKLTLRRTENGQGAVVAENDDWEPAGLVNEVSEEIGAFLLDNESASSGMVIWLDPGVYTVQVSAASGDPGVALVEVYDAPEP